MVNCKSALLDKIVLRKGDFGSLLPCWLLLLCFFASSIGAFSSTINATAALSRNRIAAGEVVQLDVKVTGAQQADVPSEITAEGLQIKLTGQSSEMQMVNFNVSSTVIYSYIVIPLKTGALTIPPVTVRAGGQVMKTVPLQLSVLGGSNAPLPSSAGLSQKASSRSTSSHQRSASLDQDRLGFAEMSIPKRKFYVGEIIPIEVRCYFNEECEVLESELPSFSGEGILTDRFKEGEERREEHDGSFYHVVSFYTLFSVIKPGVLELPPVMLNAIIALPAALPAGIDRDLFSRLLGSRSPLIEKQKITLKTKPFSCEVMPLPLAGRPNDFSGAIGTFQLEGAAAPQKVALGDPVTLSLKLSGTGNFQALKAPLLTGTQGWRTYPPADHFTGKDILGWKGVKTFDVTMIAEQALTATPGSLFSYFDPIAAKYVTLTTPPLPLEVTKNSLSTPPTGTPAAAPKGDLSSLPHETTTPTVEKPLEQLTEHAWNDPLHQKEWLLAWGSFFVATVMLVAFLAARAYTQRERSPQEQAQYHLSLLLTTLEQEELAAQEFYEKAAAAAKLIRERGNNDTLQLEEIIKTYDEIQYGGRNTFLRDEEKKRIIAQLKKLSI